MPSLKQGDALKSLHLAVPGWKPPVYAVFLLAFAAVYAAHWPLLHLPYYWDEAGYYIPAAFDFFRSGSLIPFSTLSNAHPPLPSIYLAAFWKVFGYSPFVTRSAMCAMAGLALTAVWRIALIVSVNIRVALATLLLTAVYPVYFAQSSLAHADLFAAAATLWALAFYLNRRTWPAVVCFALAALSKETAIITPLALAGWQLWIALRTRSSKPARVAAALAIPVVPLALWYLYYWHRTGFIFGNPYYLRYNATATLTPLRFLVALWHRTNQLALHMDMFVPVLLALACLLLDRLTQNEVAAPDREHRSLLLVVIIANALFFSILGGALLTRYLLPVYPLILLLCALAFRARLRHWAWPVAFSLLAFVVALFVNPPYRFAPEDNLAYADMIHLQQDAISQILARYPNQTVLTAWPASDELTKPYLGYVSQPVPTTTIDDFSLQQIQHAAQADDSYTVALIFSTKYAPSWSITFGRFNQRMDARYFDFHRDLDPVIVARLLGGQVVWNEHRKGQWAAMLHFDRPPQSRLALTSPTQPFRSYNP